MPKKRKPVANTKAAYYIRRDSHVDDTRFFSDEGHRIYFDKAAWAAWLVGPGKKWSNFSPDQNARVVRGAVQSDDVPFQGFLELVLPETVVVGDYLTAVEKATRGILNGTDVSHRRVRAFLKRQRARYPAEQVL